MLVLAFADTLSQGKKRIVQDDYEVDHPVQVQRPNDDLSGNVVLVSCHTDSIDHHYPVRDDQGAVLIEEIDTVHALIFVRAVTTYIGERAHTHDGE